MIYDFGLAWRNLRNRLIETLIPIMVVGLAIALSVIVIVLADGAEEGVIQASDPFGVLVIGASGSEQELVLSSILLQGNPIGNIPYDVYENLGSDPRVRFAVPLAFGDNIQGMRIIGTNSQFFELRVNQSATSAFKLAEGHLLEEHDENEHAFFEAVLGSKAAEKTGLQIGDTFHSTHGVTSGIAENIHDDAEYVVVGILQPSNTAYDSAVYTHISSVWHSHENEETIPSSIQETDLAAGHEEITAILVMPVGFIEQNQIAQEFYMDPTLQAAFPGRALTNLLDLLNQGQKILNLVGYLVLGIASLTVFLSMYSAILSRKQSIAIMRGLGNNQISIFRIIIFETLIVSILGSVVGRILGYMIAGIIASILSRESAIPIPLQFLPEIEVLLWGVSLGVGLLAGIIPAFMAYRVNVVENLFPS